MRLHDNLRCWTWTFCSWCSMTTASLLFSRSGHFQLGISLDLDANGRADCKDLSPYTKENNVTHLHLILKAKGHLYVFLPSFLVVSSFAACQIKVIPTQPSRVLEQPCLYHFITTYCLDINCDGWSIYWSVINVT